MFHRFRRIRKLFPLGFHTEYLFEHRLELIPFTSSDRSLEIRVLLEGELFLLHEVWKVDLAKAHSRVRRGDLCFAGFLSGRIASYHWVQYSGVHYLQQAGILYKVLPDEGWIYHVRVADWARGRNINSVVYSRILQDARERGKRLVHIYTGARNEANQKGLAKCGFTLTAKYYSIRSGNRYFLLFRHVRVR